MSYQTILFDQEAGVATITFNRPDKLNALNHEMLTEFKDALDRVSRDPEVGCCSSPGPAGPSSPGRTSRFFWNLTP